MAIIKNLIRTIDRDQQGIKIKVIQMGRATRDLAQQISTADHFIQRSSADTGQNFTDFLRIEGNQINHFVRRPSEFFTQVLILSTDANRASIGLALPHHDTTHRYQSRRTDPIFFCTKHRCHNNISACAQPTIRTQSHPLTQIVHRQNLMRFCQPHFPRQASKFNRCRWRCSRTAIMA